VWRIDTRALGSGKFVGRLTLRDQSGQSTETVVLFEVIDPVAEVGGIR
jgi:hypothetical protein